MNPLTDDKTAIARILEHLDGKTTHLGDETWQEPVSNYTSPERFEAELRVMRRTPTPFCPVAALPKTGSYVAREAAGTPIVAMRGQDGQIRAFRNSCRHRGMQVVDGHGCKSALTCRFHAWSYAPDGSLRGLPQAHGFPGLDRKEHGLVPVTTATHQGIVWVTQDGDERPVLEQMPDLFGEGFRYIDVTEQHIPANWKFVIEGMLEGYHIRSTHSETFYPRQYDNLNLVEGFGRNTRITFPFQNIERIRNLPVEHHRAREVTTQVYHLFPNAALATFPTHNVLFMVEPLAIDRSVIITYTLTDIADDDLLAKAREFVNQGLVEDRDAQAGLQRGLAARANTVMTFGLFEWGIVRFHKHLTAALQAG